MHRQRLVRELDGAQHVELQQAKYDAQRTRDLEQRGLKVLRFDDRQALLEAESVLEAIFQAVKIPPNRFTKGRHRPIAGNSP
jgi:very-short-patch-repair endonuclease